MSEEWDTVVKIGKGVNRGGGGPREKVVKGQAELNAIRRSGAAIVTEKKYGTAQSAGKGVDGQKLASVANDNDVVPTDKLDKAISTAIEKGIAAKSALTSKESGKQYTRADLAAKTSITSSLIDGWINRTAKPPKHKPSEAEFNRMEAELGIYLRGKLIGQPKPAKVFKRNLTKDNK